MSDEECRSPIGLDCCSCCLDLANGYDTGTSRPGHNQLDSPTVTHFRQLRDQLMFQNLNTDKLNNIMRQDSLESVVRDPCFLLNEGVCNSNIDQTMLSILLFFHREARPLSPTGCAPRLTAQPQRSEHPSVERAMSYPYPYPPLYSPSLFKRRDRRASGASVVAIDNKIEQAMDLVKNHLMYAVREEVEILKEQIKELAEKNNQLERENSLLKNLASPEQMEKFQSRVPSEALLALESQQGGGAPDQACSFSTGSAV